MKLGPRSVLRCTNFKFRHNDYGIYAIEKSMSLSPENVLLLITLTFSKTRWQNYEDHDDFNDDDDDKDDEDVEVMPRKTKKKWTWHVGIIDKIHVAKNKHTQIFKALKKLPQVCQLGLKGTTI